MKVAIVGAGAMGCLYAGAFHRAGAEVMLVDVNPKHIAAINRSGLRITGRLTDDAASPAAGADVTIAIRPEAATVEPATGDATPEPIAGQTRVAGRVRDRQVHDPAHAGPVECRHQQGDGGGRDSPVPRVGVDGVAEVEVPVGRLRSQRLGPVAAATDVADHPVVEEHRAQQ